MGTRNIVIAGAGPAGMMAAISAAGKGYKIKVLEKNASCGKKLLMTGNGRCNLTNSLGLDAFLAGYGRNGPFLRNAFKNLFNRDLARFFEKRGLECAADDDGRIFPRDNKASSVLRILENELAAPGISVFHGYPLSKISVSGGHITAVQPVNGEPIACRALILATGGLSYPSTGSAGEGLNLAGGLGHTIIPPRPGLVPLIIKENYSRSLSGLSMSGVSVKINSPRRRYRSKKGDIIFTSDGISGPLILSLSGMVHDLIRKIGPVRINVDLFPDMSCESLSAELSRELERGPSKIFKNSLKALMPGRLAVLLPEISGIAGDKRSGNMTRGEISSLVSVCKAFPLTATGTYGIKKAMVTRGGVSLKEIDPGTMSSKIVRGLYFAGEIMDIDGDTGGFNLQAAFSTGHLAGLSAARDNI